MSDANPLIDDPAAVLITDDPTGNAAVRFVWVANLSMRDYQRFSMAANVMADVHGSNMFAYVREAGMALMRELGEGYKALYENQISHVQMDDIEQWGVRLRTAVLGLCSSIHHHQDQSLMQVKREYGEGSPEHEAMRRVFSSLYDSCFGYRFLYKMRNAMVHHSMFVTGFGAESHRNGGDPLHWFNLTLNRSVLLEQPSYLNATLRSELEALPEDPELVEMMTEAVRELLKANKKVVEILNPNIAEICSALVEFDALFGDQEGVRAISKSRSQEMRPGMRVSYHPVSMRSLKAAHKYVSDAADSASPGAPAV